MDLKSAIYERRSCRAYARRDVPRELVKKILEFAFQAPSALNLQPWEVVVVMGEERERLIRRLCRAYDERVVSCGPGSTRPLPLEVEERSRSSFTPLVEILKDMGLDLQGFISHGSLSFYGAPVCLILCIDNAFSSNRLICMGIFVGYLLLGAHEMGLGTCPLGLVTSYEDEIKEQLNIPEDKRVVLGIAMGYPDHDSPINGFRTPRKPVKVATRWIV